MENELSFYTNVFQRNGKLFVRGYEDDGEAFARIISDYEPYLFLPGQDGGYKTINGTPVFKKYFKNLRSAYDFIKQYKDVENAEYYGMSQFVYTYINDTWSGKVDFNYDYLSIVSLDIEVESRNGFPNINDATEKVTAITLVKKGKSITFGCKDFTPKQERSQYVQCLDEEDLLKRFLSTWNSPDWAPDIVTGWSADLFDIPYLVHRITRLLGEHTAKRLSPFNFVEQREVIRAKGSTYKNFNDRKEVVYELYGITILDYLQLYKKLTFTNHPSYSLNAIAKTELNKEKVKYTGSLDDLYDNDPQTYYEYNIEDSFLVDEMETAKNFIRFIVSLAYEAKINFVDGMVTLRPWDVIIHNYLLERNIVIPQYKRKPARHILGGYVKESQVGFFKWVVSFDFESLYPSIIVQHNISPDKIVDKQPATSPEHIVNRDIWPELSEYSVCANGTRYNKDSQGFIPEIIEVYMKKRKDLKNEMQRLKKEDKEKHKVQIKILDSQQQAVKILNNGLYGALSMEYFRWYDADLAEAVTTTSQVCTRYVEKQINKWLNELLKTSNEDYVIAADTDSIYINLQPLIKQFNLDEVDPLKVTEFVDKICVGKISPNIQTWCNEVCQHFNVFKPRLNMKREAIIEKAVWRAPKMYAAKIWDMEGVRYNKAELKIKGMESVRSSTPVICRNKIKEILNIILDTDQTTMQEFIEKFREEYNQLPLSDIASPRSVDGIITYSDPVNICTKGTPIHVRGALIYNHAIKTLGLERKYPMIKDKDKIRFMPLREPNHFNSHVIAMPSDQELPPEFEINDYVDKDEQFYSTFEKPVESICSLLGWKTVAINDLKEFL